MSFARDQLSPLVDEHPASSLTCGHSERPMTASPPPRGGYRALALRARGPENWPAAAGKALEETS